MRALLLQILRFETAACIWFVRIGNREFVSQLYLGGHPQPARFWLTAAYRAVVHCDVLVSGGWLNVATLHQTIVLPS